MNALRTATLGPRQGVPNLQHAATKPSCIRPPTATPDGDKGVGPPPPMGYEEVMCNSGARGEEWVQNLDSYRLSWCTQRFAVLTW